MCDRHIKIDDSWISEEDINKIYRNFEIIQKLIWNEKFDILFIRKLSKYNETEINNLQYFIEIKSLIWSGTIYRRIERVIETDVNDVRKVWTIKEKLLKIINYINIHDIKKLAKITETEIDNLINNWIEINKVTWKKANWSSELLLMIEVWTEKIKQFIKNKEEFDKLTWNKDYGIDYSIYDLKILFEINDEELNNIIKNKEKIKELTWSITLLKAKQIKTLSKITTNDYENFIRNKNDIWNLLYWYWCKERFKPEVILEFSKLNDDQIKELTRLKRILWAKIQSVEEIKYLVKFSEYEFKTIKEWTKEDPRKIIEDCCSEENCTDI